MNTILPGKLRVLTVAAGLLLGAPFASLATEAPADHLWPVRIDAAVSSNFCEYREGHLHAGLDIRTLGKEGVACLASADGYVSRIRASSRGYGKALYVQIDGGETLVYAHLSEFSPALEGALLNEQRRRDGCVCCYAPM